MWDELGRETTDFVAIELAVKNEKRAAGQVQRDLCFTLIHWQQETVPANAAFVAERLTHCVANTNRGVLDRMMFVDFEITVALDLQTEAAVFRNLLEHVVVETNTRTDSDRIIGIEVNGGANRCLACFSLYLRLPRANALCVGDCRPGYAVAHLKSSIANVLGELPIGFAIADDRGRRHIQIGSRQITRQEAGCRFATSATGGRRMRTDENFVEDNPLRFE